MWTMCEIHDSNSNGSDIFGGQTSSSILVVKLYRLSIASSFRDWGYQDRWRRATNSSYYIVTNVFTGKHPNTAPRTQYTLLQSRNNIFQVESNNLT